MGKNRITSLNDLSLEPRDTPFPSPSEWRDQFIYFLLVDRFNDGKRRPQYDSKTTLQNRDASNGERFQGGTISGITKRLSYIKNLGATAVWISPVLKNRIEDEYGYHAYGVQNFLEIDPRFGSTEDFKKLVQEAHKQGLYVILDIIINHTGNNWGYVNDMEPGFRTDGKPYEFGFWRRQHAGGTESHGEHDAVWPVEFQNPDWYQRFGRIGNWEDKNEAQNGDFFGFKELNLNHPDVIDALVKVYSYWIAETDLDGFRIDTIKHVSSDSTAIFSSRIQEFARRIGKQNFFVFGEVIGSDETIKEYLIPKQIPGTPDTLSTLDAALDFPLYFFLEEVIKGFCGPEVLSARYEKLHGLYPETDVSDSFVRFIDNHDQVARNSKRFLYHSYPEQAVLGIGYLLTSLGIPCIYYGTEQGFDGGEGSDKLIRENMFGGEWGAFGTTGAHFFNEDRTIYTAIKEIAEIRQNEPALRFGRQYFRNISRDGSHFYFPTVQDGILVYSRIIDNEEIVIIMNLSNTHQECFVSIDQTLNEKDNDFVDLLLKHAPLVTEGRSGQITLHTALVPFQISIFKKREVT
ncbi:MAG: alpha-amylase family glycosyl hydrolase [Candidatus Paceibacterota bacterium]